MSANKEQKRSWYQRNKERLSQQRRSSRYQLAGIQQFGTSPYREFSVPTIGEEEEGYTFLDFLLETETE